MKKAFFVSITIFFFLNITANAETRFGAEGIATTGEDNIFSVDRAIVLSSPNDEETGEETLSDVCFLFEGKQSAGFLVTLDCVGKGYLSVVDTEKSTIGDIREIIFPIGDMEKIDSDKKFVIIAGTARYMDQNGNIEVHIATADNLALTLNSVSLEFITSKSEAEIRKEINLVRRSFGEGFIPPGVPEVYLSFHHGAVWLCDEDEGGYRYYDLWWGNKRRFKTPPQINIFQFGTKKPN